MLDHPRVYQVMVASDPQETTISQCDLNVNKRPRCSHGVTNFVIKLYETTKNCYKCLTVLRKYGIIVG